MPEIFRSLKIQLLLGCFLVGSNFLWATHNRAGEISIEQVGNCVTSLQIKATLITYTKDRGTPVDRDSLTICWGDGTCETVLRINGPGDPPKGEILENNVKKNIYIAFHTFPARGTYVISMTDPNRNGGILNVNFPNSDQIKFYIQTVYTFPNPQFQGCNNTPVLLQPPIDVGCVGQRFIHNPNAYDEDGDSLSYHIIVPLQDVDLPVPNYQFPNMISPGPDNRLTIDEVTGDIVWDSPQRAGEYNLAIIIVEYRDGFPLDTIIRDMQILIQECDNKPPIVETPFEEICVVAGDTLEFDVRATAPLDETTQKVRLNALGGPFEIPFSPATFTPEDDRFLDDPVIKMFQWIIPCEAISDQFYSVVFKATDNHFRDTSGLATLKTVRIKVVGPPPQGLRAVPGNGQVELTWDKPYSCEDAADNYFRGFTVWRREGSNNFSPDTCSPGLAGQGYVKLNQVAMAAEQDGRYFFVDLNVERGRTYCYRILAEFAKTTPGGQYTYNVVESLPSEEVCVQLSRDVPLLTQVDVRTTATQDGRIRVCWTKPRAEDLDTLLNPGPYTYEIWRATGTTVDPSDFQPIGIEFTSTYFALANDTCYIDQGLNTVENSYSYLVNFYVAGSTSPLGATNPGSSVFLRISPSDRSNILRWEEEVPWENYEYIIYRQSDQGQFEAVDTVQTATYTDRGLVNGQEYCYTIQSVGSYGIGDIIDPILNFSQETCGVPFDNVPPCTPDTLLVTNICNETTGCSGITEFTNTIQWVLPENCDLEDIAGYDLYFASVEEDELQLIASIDDPKQTSFEHKLSNSVAGCYGVRVYDRNGNRSGFAPIVCVDNCPTYTLPNAFTPNEDGTNDVFRPYPYCFIDQVEFQVFNRWGQLVFQTSNPDLEWDGKNLNGNLLPDGTYFYVCKVFEKRVSGTIQRPDLLKGYIELIRGE